MSEEEFAGEAGVFLEPFGVFGAGSRLLGDLGDLRRYIVKNVFDRRRRVRFLNGNVLVAGGNVEFDIRHSGTVLSAVVLFFHQQTELVETVEGGSVFLFVEAQRLQKTDHCNSAFMLDRIAHGESLSGKFSPLKYIIFSIFTVRKQKKQRFLSVTPSGV